MPADHEAPLPCPFCGGEAEFEALKNDGLRLRCLECGVERRQRVLRQTLDWLRSTMTDSWNRRALSTPTPPQPVNGEVVARTIYEARMGYMLSIPRMGLSPLTWAQLGEVDGGRAPYYAAANALAKLGLEFTSEERQEAARALKPFAEACEHLHPSSPDDGVTLDGFNVSDFRQAAAALAKLEPSDGR